MKPTCAENTYVNIYTKRSAFSQLFYLTYEEYYFQDNYTDFSLPDFKIARYAPHLSLCC